MELRTNKRFDDEGTDVIYIRKGEQFPNMGFNRATCPHPSKYMVYGEWESDILGHGWFCSLCGKVMQVG